MAYHTLQDINILFFDSDQNGRSQVIVSPDQVSIHSAKYSYHVISHFHIIFPYHISMSCFHVMFSCHVSMTCFHVCCHNMLPCHVFIFMFSCHVNRGVEAGGPGGSFDP
jgi:hypothetical protein